MSSTDERPRGRRTRGCAPLSCRCDLPVEAAGQSRSGAALLQGAFPLRAGIRRRSEAARPGRYAGQRPAPQRSGWSTSGGVGALAQTAGEAGAGPDEKGKHGQQDHEGQKSAAGDDDDLEAPTMRRQESPRAAMNEFSSSSAAVVS